MLSTCSPVVIRFGRLGDTILLQPFLQRLHARYGQPCHLLSLGDWAPILFAAQPEVTHHICLNSQYGPLWLRPRRWAAAVALSRLQDAAFYICEPQLRTSTKIRPLLKLAGVPNGNCQFIEDHPMLENEHWLDWLERFGETTPPAFVHHFGNGPFPVTGAPVLQTTALEREDRDAWLHARQLTGHPLVLLQLANKRSMRWSGIRNSANDDKSWPATHWAAAAKAMTEYLPGARMLLCGAPSEEPYLKQAFKAFADIEAVVELAVLPLGRLKALMGVANSMISVDTGPAHLAAAMGCPLVVLFGNRSPLRWAPRSGLESEVRVIGGLPFIQRIDQIEVVQVVDTWKQLARRATPVVPHHMKT